MEMSDVMAGLLSPAASGAVVWMLLSKYFEAQSELLKNVSSAINDLKTKMAVHESRAALIDDMRKDVNMLRDELTKTKASLEAAWRVIDVRRKSEGE